MRTDDELNRMAAGVLGECYHVLGSERPPECQWIGCQDVRHGACKFCGKLFPQFGEIENQPDFLADANQARRLAMAVGERKLGRVLLFVVGNGDGTHRATKLATLPARTLTLCALCAAGLLSFDELKEVLANAE